MIYIIISLAVVVLLGVSVLCYMWYEAGNLEIKQLKFTKSKKGLKIVQLSDIHIDLLRVKASKISEVIEKEAPDFIIMSGDYITKQRNIPKFIDFLKEIKNHNTIYLCLGNHDYEAFSCKRTKEFYEYVQKIQNLGITVLHDQCKVFEKDSVKYNVIGISDLRRGEHDVEKAFKDAASDAKINIAFSHNPDICLSIPKGKADYLFCGHFHGGQIWLPFDLEFTVLRKEKLCKMGVKRGLHKVNNINLYINRGIGNVLVPFRLFSKPEITVIYLP